MNIVVELTTRQHVSTDRLLRRKGANTEGRNSSGFKYTSLRELHQFSIHITPINSLVP